MKKVLYISYDGMTDPLGQSQVLPYLEGLSKVGYRFTLLSFEKKEAFKKFGTLIREKCAAANIEWVPLVFHTRPPVLAKIADKYKLFKTAQKLHREKQFDLTHCRSYIAAELGLFLKKKYGVKFIFDMRGFWADEKAETGHWNQQKWMYRKIYRRYKNLEREFVREADHIISLTEAGKKELGRLYDGLFGATGVTVEKKCMVIPCCADLAHFDFNRVTKEQTLEYKKKLQIDPSVPVLSYSGSLGDWYMLDEMLQFFQAFRKKHPGAIFLVLSRELPRLKDAMERNNIDSSTVVTGFSSYQELPLYLSVIDFSVFLIKPIYSKIASSPTKHAELMGMGIPVFCNDIGDTGYFLRHYPLGELITTIGEDFPAALERVERKVLDKEKIREVARQYFGLPVGVQRYKAVYDALLSPGISN